MTNKTPKYEKPTFDGLEIYTPKSQRQFDFMWSDTDITVFGGAAGSGKSYVGICRFLRFIEEPEYIGYIIRKTASSLRTGAFETAKKIFKAACPDVKINQNEM